MSGGSYDYLYCKECDELFTYSSIRTLEEMESRFLELGYEDVAKDFRRLIEYIKSANNRVEVLGGQLNEMMHDIEWYDSGDIGADTLAKKVEKYRQADTPQTEERPAGCSKDWSTSCTSCERYFSCDYLSGRQTGTGSPIGDYRDGAGAWAPMPLGDPGSISDGTLLTALETWLNRNPDKQIKVDKRITRHGPVFTASIELAPWTIQKEG